MKFRHLGWGTLLVFVAFFISHTAQAQSSDTTNYFSVNQSYFWQQGIKPATTPILLQGPGGATKSISVINQNPQSLVEALFYTINGSTRCSFLQMSPWYSSQAIGCPYNVSPVIPFGSSGIFRSGVTYPETFLPTLPGEFTFYNQTVAPQESAMLNQIQTNGTLTVDGGDGNGNDGYASVPMTNCVHLSGTGPLKVIFMRGSSANTDINDFLWWVSDGIDNGFKALDPFRSYISQFSFYADLQVRNDVSDTNKIVPLANPDSSSPGVAQQIKNSSSCGGSGALYIDYSPDVANHLTTFGSSVGVIGLGLVIMNPVKDATVPIPGSISKYPSLSLMHEIGHAFGGLFDEYSLSNNPSVNALSQRVVPWLYSSENCSSNPTWDYRSTIDYKVYGSVTANGCTYLHNSLYGTKGVIQLTNQGSFHRPSDQDLMLGGYLTDVTKAKFNVISCGYLISAIKGEALKPSNAQTHWSECLTMAKAGTIVSDGIPTPANPPVLNPITNSSLVPGDDLTITGTGLSPTSNSIKLTPKSPTSFIDALEHTLAHILGSVAEAQTSGNTYYILSDIPSNGSSLNFKFPADIPNGTYDVQVSALNSDWSSPFTITVSGSNSAPGEGVTGGSTGGSGGNTTPPPAGSINATATYTCPSGYTLNSSNICNKPANIQQQTATFAANTTYSCPSGYILSGPTCSGNGTVFNATISYSCSQAGISPSYNNGLHQCVIPAGYVWSPASTASPKLSYSCPSGYLPDPSGTTCHQNVSPVNLYASASVGNINLQWQAYPYRQVSSYAIERAPGGTTKFAQIATAQPYTAGGSSQYGAYNDASVSVGQKYTYRVRSLFPDGSYSDYSGSADVTAFKTSAPKVKVTPNSASEITFTWTDSDPGIVGYHLNGTMSGITSADKKTSSFQDSNLLPKTKYCYSVQAVFTVASSAILSPASTPACTSTQTPVLTLTAPSGGQLSLTTNLSLVNTNRVAHITSVDLYVGKSSTPLVTSKSASSIPLNTTSLANGSYKAYAVVHFDSGATFKTKTITVAVNNTVPTAASLSKSLAVPDGNSADTDATYTDPNGQSQDVQADQINAPVTQAPVSQSNQTPPPVVANPTNPTTAPTALPATAVASPMLNPTVSAISGATQLTVGGEAKWSFTATDPQNSSLTYSMNWGDSSPISTSAVPSFKHSYASAGTYTITAVATNNSGLTGKNTLTVVANASTPTQTITQASSGNYAPAPVSVFASVVDASSDKAGVWNVWGPGPGRVNGNNAHDWHVNATLSNASGKTLSYATIIMNGIREGWSSSASTNNAFGVQLYPLVLVAPGFTTTGADQTYAITSGMLSLDMYVQPEDAAGTTFKGATLTIGFTDGTSVTTQIGASSISIPAATVSLAKGYSTATIFDAIGNWFFGAFNW